MWARHLWGCVSVCVCVCLKVWRKSLVLGTYKVWLSILMGLPGWREEIGFVGRGGSADGMHGMVEQIICYLQRLPGLVFSTYFTNECDVRVHLIRWPSALVHMSITWGAWNNGQDLSPSQRHWCNPDLQWVPGTGIFTSPLVILTAGRVRTVDPALGPLFINEEKAAQKYPMWFKATQLQVVHSYSSIQI